MSDSGLLGRELGSRAAETTSVSSLVWRHPLSSFFVATYAVSWALWLPLVVSGQSSPDGLGSVLLLLGSLAPSTTAVVLVALMYGRRGLGQVLGRLRLWRVGAAWWLAIAALPALGVAAVGVSVIVGGRSPDVTVTLPGAAILLLISIFPGSAGGEELGWRGFALPRLQAVRSALRASVVLGAAWGIWHLPLYLVGSDLRPPSLFVPWVLLAVAVSVMCTWIYNGTGGSLLLLVIFHAASNLPLTVFFEPLGDQVVRPFVIYVGLMVAAAAVIVAITGPATLSRTHAKQTAAP